MTDSPPAPISDHDIPGDPPRVAAPLVETGKSRRRTPAEEARTLVADSNVGTLATLSDDGSPWASLVAYGSLDDGAPVLFVSQLAEHARNLEREPRASLAVVTRHPAEDVLAGGRVTLAGRVERPDGELAREAQDRYVAAVPSAKAYVDFRDFSLWILRVERVRWVGGYGRMNSASAADYARAEPDPVVGGAAHAVAHLNDDHADALLAMAQALAGHPDADAASCTGIDRYGLDLSIATPRGPAFGRVGFAEPVSEPAGLRGATVELARRARGA